MNSFHVEVVSWPRLTLIDLMKVIMNINIARVTCFSFVITISTLSLATAPRPPIRGCEMQTPCSCSMSDGSGDIDLTSLSGPNGQPKFKDVLNTDEGYYYSYSPCGAFSEVQCNDATACVLDENKDQSQQIGDSGRAAFKYDGDHVVVAYTSGTGVLKLTEVSLICDPTACDPIFVPNGEQGAGQFEMTLTTICACPGKCSASGPTSGCHSNHPSKGGSAGGLSVGTILVIIFFVTLLLYLVAGLAYMRFRKQATGSDIIPNKEFWVVLPSHVLNGGKFVVAKILRKEASYNKI
ncbi:uncharacterized protein LOC127854430 isoform X2 [Dreissena polymorpha]|nr:uncharacterized protein LOC127854430 isoform X1 [Dreissena polymorpha]XP_052245422.1 uncharacterized protein LOC127854430 isoform X2 [Dreissena polymorpha]